MIDSSVRWAGGSYQASLRLSKNLVYEAMAYGYFDATITECFKCGRKISPATPGNAVCDSCKKRFDEEWDKFDKEQKKKKDEEIRERGERIARIEAEREAEREIIEAGGELTCKKCGKKYRYAATSWTFEGLCQTCWLS